MTTDSRTLLMDKTISRTVTPLSSSILRTDAREYEEDIERRLDIITDHPAPRPSPMMFSKGFLEKGDPEVARARAIYFKSYLLGFGVMVVTIFIVFSIYWGSLWRIPAHSLQGWIVVSVLPVSFIHFRAVNSQGF
jgi:cobalamin biosynthesis protein CobD/CbiB